jgi:hypothetical protein
LDKKETLVGTILLKQGKKSVNISTKKCEKVTKGGLKGISA